MKDTHTVAEGAHAVQNGTMGGPVEGATDPEPHHLTIEGAMKQRWWSRLDLDRDESERNLTERRKLEAKKATSRQENRLHP